MTCETETVVVEYFIDVEFDDQATPGVFGPISTRDTADAVMVALAGRQDVKKATLRKEIA